MSEGSEQNFENYVRHDKLAYGYLATYLIAAICAIVGLFGDVRFIGVAAFLTAAAGLLAGVNARGYGIMVQNRVVRLEMRLRLERLLDDEMQARIPEFTVPQLVGLRFASDAELPALARKTLDENLTKSNDIKRLVTDWQADHMRV